MVRNREQLHKQARADVYTNILIECLEITLGDISSNNNVRAGDNE